MYNDDELMDIDGPEFVSEVNSQIAAIRSASASQQASGSAASGNEDLSAYYDYYRRGMQGSPVAQEYAATPFMQVAVIDANFLISNLGYLKTLTSQAAKYRGSLGLVIPWIVVKELDELKGMNNQRITHGGVGSWSANTNAGTELVQDDEWQMRSGRPRRWRPRYSEKWASVGSIEARYVKYQAQKQSGCERG